MAAHLRRELGVEVALESGPYGRASVLVDGETVASTGLSGWLPTTSIIVERVRTKLAASPHGGPPAGSEAGPQDSGHEL